MFFARYFDLISQEFVIRKFYRGDLKVDLIYSYPLLKTNKGTHSGKIGFL